MKKFSSPFPNENMPSGESADPGNGVRTSVELNRNEKLRDKVWVLLDEDSSGERKREGYETWKLAERSRCSAEPRSSRTSKPSESRKNGATNTPLPGSGPMGQAGQCKDRSCGRHEESSTSAGQRIGGRISTQCIRPTRQNGHWCLGRSVRNASKSAQSLGSGSNSVTG